MSRWVSLNRHGFVERAEQSEIEAALFGEQRTMLALLGPPGGGKSAMLARVGNKLRDKGHNLLAIKADLLPSNVGSLRELDEWLQVPESLPVLVERLAAESPITILIDLWSAKTPYVHAATSSNQYS
jgi:hypothetical protein